MNFEGVLTIGLILRRVASILPRKKKECHGITPQTTAKVFVPNIGNVEKAIYFQLSGRNQVVFDITENFCNFVQSILLLRGFFTFKSEEK